MVKDKECMKEERVRYRHEAGVSWNTPQPKSCLRSGVGEFYPHQSKSSFHV